MRPLAFALFTCLWLFGGGITPPMRAQSVTPPAEVARHKERQAARLLPHQIAATTTATDLIANADGHYATVPQAPTWVQSAGPETGSTLSFAKKDGRLYAGSFGGLWVSENNGDNWQLVSNLLVSRPVRAVAANTSAIFAGAAFGGTGGGLYRSLNNGQTWQAINQGFPAPRAIAFLFAAGNVILAHTTTDGIYASTNNGDSWTKLTNGLPTQLLARLGASQNALFILNFASELPELFRSTDSGATWAKVNLPLAAGVFPVQIGSNANRVYIGTSNGMLVSEDGGQTWRALTGLPAGGVGYAPLVGGTSLYAAQLGSFESEAPSEIFASTDNGVTWTKRSTVPFSMAADFFADGQSLFFGTAAGAYRSVDGGATFALSNRGLRSAVVLGALAQSGERLLVSTYGGGVWGTNDQGATWRALNRGLPFYSFIGGLTTSGNAVYAALEQPVAVYRSTDAGETWTRTASTGLTVEADAAPQTLAANGGKLYLGLSAQGAWVSEDNGANWKALGGGLPADASIRSFAFKDNSIFVATSGKGIFRSTDGGQTFAAINNGLTTQFGNQLLHSGTALWLAASNGIYRSTDDGGTWTRVLANASYAALTRSGNTIYGAGGAGIYASKDNGATWQVNNNGLFGVLTQLGVQGDKLIAATNGSGVFFQTEDRSAFATVSAASFSANAIADKTIVAAFGTALAAATAAATSLPLPTTLAGTTVRIKDAAGTERPAPLFFVSAGQINFQIPAGTANGEAVATITNSAGTAVTGTLDVRTTAPALFAANATGAGAAAAIDAIRYTAGPFDTKQANGEPNILALFGTGLGADATDVDGNVASSVTTRLNGVVIPTLYAGRVPGLVGLNQFNVQLPTNLPAGTYGLTVTRGGVTSNTVTVTLR